MSAHYQPINTPALIANGWSMLYGGWFCYWLGPGRQLSLSKRGRCWDLTIKGPGGTVHLTRVADLQTLSTITRAIEGA